MRDILICPQCGDGLVEFESFFACKSFHKYLKDINGNIKFGKGAALPFTLYEIGEREKIKARFDANGISSEIAKAIPSADRILICGDTNFSVAEKLADFLPNTDFYIVSGSKKELKYRASTDRILCLAEDSGIFRQNSFDGIISFCGQNFNRNLLSKNGKFIRIFFGENTGKELYSFGFPKVKEKVPLFGDFVEIKRVALESRIYLSEKEAAAFFTAVHKSRNVPEELSAFEKGFVTARINVSIYEKN